MKKLSKAQAEVLKAYRDNTNHNHRVSVTESLLKASYLVPVFNDNEKSWSLEISKTGLEILIKQG